MNAVQYFRKNKFVITPENIDTLYGLNGEENILTRRTDIGLGAETLYKCLGFSNLFL